MEDYLQNRQNLLKVVQLVDIRHEPSAQDIQMYDYLRHYGLDGLIVATKADKVSRNQMSKCLKTIRQALDLSDEDVILYYMEQHPNLKGMFGTNVTDCSSK